MPGTVKLHRVLMTTPDKVYRAFTEPGAYTRWLPPNGHYATLHSMDGKVGGGFRMSFTNFTSGNGHSFEGTYLELKPCERIVYTTRFDDPNLPGEMTNTIELKAVSVGTDMTVVQDGIPDVIPPEACYLGWQECLLNLARLVEPDIPG